jgi:Flp pilus assembly protein TadG
VAAAELAILLPFLALLFFVAVDYCRAFHAAQVIDGCARAGAMYASGASARDPDAAATPTTADAARQAAVAEGAGLSPPVRPENVAVVAGPGVVTVTVTYTYPVVTGFTGLSDGFTITRSVTMAVAPQPPGAR